MDAALQRNAVRCGGVRCRRSATKSAKRSVSRHRHRAPRRTKKGAWSVRQPCPEIMAWSNDPETVFETRTETDRLRPRLHRRPDHEPTRARGENGSRRTSACPIAATTQSMCRASGFRRTILLPTKAKQNQLGALSPHSRGSATHRGCWCLIDSCMRRIVRRTPPAVHIHEMGHLHCLHRGDTTKLTSLGQIASPNDNRVPIDLNGPHPDTVSEPSPRASGSTTRSSQGGWKQGASTKSITQSEWCAARALSIVRRRLVWWHRALFASCQSAIVGSHWKGYSGAGR